jgi:D-serine deaminase-like pyridoxal phosphate-dependent protein
VLTPALLIDADAVDSNIRTTIAAVGGDPRRWRPHFKTAKLDWTARRLLRQGVTAFKCATTLELATLAGAGAADVLFAMPLSAASAVRVGEIGRAHPDMTVSALADSEASLDWWPPDVGLVIDLDSGMRRTGIPLDDGSTIERLALRARAKGLRIDGLHSYDGHLAAAEPGTRKEAVRRALDQIAGLSARLAGEGIRIARLTTSGTPTFLDAVGHEGVARARLHHELSPGTVVYSDVLTDAVLGERLPYRPAAQVRTRVISAPRRGWVTCDAGHKAVSADAGVPTCVVAGRADLEPAEPSEEHMTIRVAGGAAPAVGELLTLIPRHVCPTVNLYDAAILVRDGQPARVVPVTARGRETAPTRPPACVGRAAGR